MPLQPYVGDSNPLLGQVGDLGEHRHMQVRGPELIVPPPQSLLVSIMSHSRCVGRLVDQEDMRGSILGGGVLVAFN